MAYHDIVIGGVIIGLDAAHDLTQTYEEVGGRTLRRKLDGAALLQRNWGKIRTVISGRGRLPDGLEGLDYTTSMTIDCMAPRSVWGSSTTIVIPAARRTSGWVPHAYAIVAGQHVRTSLTIATNTCTLTAVTGAQGYLVAYYPSLSMYAEPPRQTFGGRGPSAGWEIVAEEA